MCSTKLLKKTRTPATVLLLYTVLLSVPAACRWRINLSSSMPLGLYRVTSAPVEGDALVEACVPLGAADFALANGYLPPGDCPGGVAPVLKRVLAVPRSEIDSQPRSLAVNGQHLAMTSSSRDSAGRSLPHAYGHFSLLGSYWLVGANPRSWDSRYFGPVPRSAIRHRVLPLWTFGGTTP